MEKKEVKSIIESLMFVYSEPISKYRFQKVINVEMEVITTALHELEEEYIKDSRGIRLIKVNDQYQLGTYKENHQYIQEFCKKSHSKGLSNAALEVLAIVAYKQPVTRIDIENIRGVRSGNLIRKLIDRKLIDIVGKLETIGTPYVYGTTDTFLRSFGLNKIEDLPSIEDFHNFEFLANFFREESVNDQSIEDEEE